MTDITPNHETFAIVPVFNGKPPSDAIVWGSISEVLEYIGQSQARVEAEERTRFAQEQLKTDAKTLAQAQQITADTATKLTAMGSAMVAAREKQARTDAEAKRVAAEQAEARRVQEMLDRLPDPDAPADDGELEIKHAPNKEHLQEQPDSFGDLPEQVIKGVPAPIGSTYEPNIANLKNPQKPTPQPIAISLNEV